MLGQPILWMVATHVNQSKVHCPWDLFCNTMGQTETILEQQFHKTDLHNSDINKYVNILNELSNASIFTKMLYQGFILINHLLVLQSSNHISQYS